MTTERETPQRVHTGLYHLPQSPAPFAEARSTAWQSPAQGATASAPLDECCLLKAMLDKWNAVFALPDGSIVKLVEVKAVPVRKHLLFSKYRVEIELKNGSTRRVVENLSEEEAEKKQAEIIRVIQQAWDEFTPYDVGHEAGRVQGYAEGWAEAHAAGLRIGRENGRSEEREYVVGVLLQRRETLVNAQQSAGKLPPSRRRYLRDAISVLSDLIGELSSEPTPDPEASIMAEPLDR